MTTAETRTRDRSIHYSKSMVLALLAAEKTQTRRVIVPQPGLQHAEQWNQAIELAQAQGYEVRVRPADGACPYGKPGDRLYVKEATWMWCRVVEAGRTATGRPKRRYIPVYPNVAYCATEAKPTFPINDEPDHCWRWKSSRFMPRWATRLVLDITDVRAERVQVISDADIEAEGVAHYAQSIGWTHLPLRESWVHLWDTINGEREDGAYLYEMNRWVWVITFRVLDRQHRPIQPSQG